jgi:glycosyl transferase family 87
VLALHTARCETAAASLCTLPRWVNARWNGPLGSRALVGFVVVALVGLLVSFRASVRPIEAAAGSDVTGYQRYGSLVLDGAVPYRDFDLEYPPGALAMFVVPATRVVARGAVDGASWSPPNEQARRYYRGFTSSVLVLLAVLLVLTASTLRALDRSAAATALSLGVVACSPLLLGQVLIERFDVLPATMVAAALATSVRGHYRLGGVFLGLGTAAKLYPAFLVPILAIAALRDRSRREAVWVVATALAAASLVFLPVASASPGDAWDSLRVQAGGGLQIETFASSALVLASRAVDALGLYPFDLATHGAGEGLVRFDLGGTGVAFLKTATTAVLVAVVCSLSIALWRSRLDVREEMLRFAAATVAALLVFGTVLSPQYVAWLLPVVPLVRGRRGTAAVVAFAVAAYLTNWWIPEHYFDYQADLEAGPAWRLLARNLALLGVLVVLVLPGRILEPRPRHAPTNEAIAAHVPGE